MSKAGKGNYDHLKTNFLISKILEIKEGLHQQTKSLQERNIEIRFFFSFKEICFMRQICLLDPSGHVA